MERTATLSEKEKEVLELIAWGASKKQVAKMLNINSRTVENLVRSIFRKTYCTKSTELSAWYFCTKYNIPFSDTPLHDNDEY